MYEASPLPAAQTVDQPNEGADACPASAERAASIQVLAPATGEVLGDVPVMTTDQVRDVVERARKAQARWARLSVRERCQRLLSFRDELVANADSLAELLAREAGKPRHEAILHEVLVTADLISYYAKEGPRWLAPERRPLRVFRYRQSEVHYDPRGVVAVIGPWNFPLQLPLRDAVAAWTAGNAAVVKPSEVTPLILLRAKQLWDSCKLPADLFGVVTGYGSTGAALIDSGVDFVAFTGSVATGRRVAAACGERLIPSLMELGGKAPLIACADADVERTAHAIVLGGFANAGQVCISVERVYAHRRIYDRLVERVTSLADELRIGDPAQQSVEVGAITFPRQIEIAEQHIADALAHGAELRCGGKRVEGYEQIFEPTVLAGCDHRCTVMTDEIFGPIVPFMKVSSEEQAVRLANDSPLGLNAYVFSKSRARARRIAEQLEAGSVMINEVLSNAAMPEAPFGGIKHSGMGRALGPEGLRAMCRIRHLSFERVPMPPRHPLAYPYTQDKYRWLLRGLKTIYDSRSGLAGKVLRKVMGI